MCEKENPALCSETTDLRALNCSFGDCLQCSYVTSYDTLRHAEIFNRFLLGFL